MVVYLFIYKFWPHHTACRTLVPWPVLNTCPLHWKLDLTIVLPGKSPVWRSYEKWNLDTKACTENALWTSGFTIIRQAHVRVCIHTHTHTHTMRQGITRSQERDLGEIFLLHLQRECSPAHTLILDSSLQNCGNILSVFYAPQLVVLC